MTFHSFFCPVVLFFFLACGPFWGLFVFFSFSSGVSFFLPCSLIFAFFSVAHTPFPWRFFFFFHLSSVFLALLWTGQEDIVEEALYYFRANVLYRNYQIDGSSDRTLIYLTFFIQQCLKELEKHPGKKEGKGPRCPPPLPPPMNTLPLQTRY